MAESFFERWVQRLELRPMASITNAGLPAGYGDAPDIARYHAPDPLYTAVHIVGGAADQPRHYSLPHVHTFPELNILAAPPGALVFRVRIGDEEQQVESPATVLIPPGVTHSANLVRGAGAFVVVRLMPQQIQAANAVAPGARR